MLHRKKLMLHIKNVCSFLFQRKEGGGGTGEYCMNHISFYMVRFVKKWKKKRNEMKHKKSSGFNEFFQETKRTQKSEHLILKQTGKFYTAASQNKYKITLLTF